jgi:hypothetical protein
LEADNRLLKIKCLGAILALAVSNFTVVTEAVVAHDRQEHAIIDLVKAFFSIFLMDKN